MSTQGTQRRSTFDKIEIGPEVFRPHQRRILRQADRHHRRHGHRHRRRHHPRRIRTGRRGPHRRLRGFPAPPPRPAPAGHFRPGAAKGQKAQAPWTHPPPGAICWPFPTAPSTESASTRLLAGGAFRLERIVSTGQSSPPGFWYDQEDGEWVALLSGAAELQFEDEGEPRRLAPGDWLHIAPPPPATGCTGPPRTRPPSGWPSTTVSRSCRLPLGQFALPRRQMPAPLPCLASHPVLLRAPPLLRPGPRRPALAVVDDRAVGPAQHDLVAALDAVHGPAAEVEEMLDAPGAEFLAVDDEVELAPQIEPGGPAVPPGCRGGRLPSGPGGKCSRCPGPLPRPA